MSFWSRIANVFSGERLSREIDEELQSHIEAAIEEGRDPAEARRAFGPALQRREQSRDIRLVTWLDSLRADAVFGWRHIGNMKVASAAAILSLALGMGACISAFRLIDALLLRPLPVADPEQLHALARLGGYPEGVVQRRDLWASYPAFHLMRAAVKDQAEMMAMTEPDRNDLTYGQDEEMEKAYVQFVSGSMFGSLGLRPAMGRLFNEGDDVKPGGHPYAVISDDYWARRFGRDPKALGRVFRMGDELYQIIGVGPERFTGLEPGTVTDIFVPTMMYPGIGRSDSEGLRTLARVKPGVALEPLRKKLDAVWGAVEKERATGFHNMRKQQIASFLNQSLLLEPAGRGVAGLQRDYRRPLAALGVLAALVLLIASANVANLMTAQAAARAREMALRVSIGAGRGRLVRLVLVESAWLAFIAAAIGGLFAWWSAPVVVGMINPPDNPARLYLPADGRVFGFGLALTVAAMLLFGLAPALRASAVKPAGALKGGEDPHARRRLMHTVVAAQTAVCFLVVFFAGLFVTTFERLTHRPMGFSPGRIVTLETVAHRPQPAIYWDQALERLRAVPGVETAALAGSALLGGLQWNSFISVNGAAPSNALTYFLGVSPGWAEAMKIPLLDGRDFRPGDTSPGVVIVNKTFAKDYFNGENPVGKTFDRGHGGARLLVVGLAGDAVYRDVREPMLPQAYIPFRSTGATGVLEPIREATFIVRTVSSNPLALASTLRREVPLAWPEFRVSNIRTQAEIDESQTVRERLLARLALFFGAVALLLAGVGLYGVLDYTVVQRRREIGIRMAVGAQAGEIARRVMADVFVVLLVGAVSGLALGMASARYIDSLFYQVKATDLAMLALPSLTIVVAALLAALPPIIRAVRIEPAAILRSE